MQDCGIKPGPVAYNIGNSSGTGIAPSCRPQSVVAGFLGSFSKLPDGTTGMGYINPRIENAEMKNKFPGNSYVVGDEWDEPVYYDYNSSAAVNYISHQVRWWKRRGAERGQSCVAVDVDNCDVIKPGNYKKVLDLIDRLNRENPKDVQIKVFVKNPQNEGCGQFMKHPVAIGAFMEELSASDYHRLAKLRANEDQLMLFAQGNQRNGREHISLERIAQTASSNLPNTAVSFDGNGSYKFIKQCTYAPARARRMETASEATAAR